MELRVVFDQYLDKNGVIILPEMDVIESMQLISSLGYRPTTSIIDPWYNRGIGGVRDDYMFFMMDIINNIKDNTDHLFIWGFPDIVARFVDKIQKPLEYVAWITWFFKNCPSVIRGWRSSQQACIHYAIKKAKMYPENFFTAEQELRFENKKMRFIPGPSSVIEEPLLVGFVGKNEQTGHPSQKPERVYEKLILMTSKINDLIFDPMVGSGTTGAVCLKHKRKCIISDISDEYLTLTEKRLGIKRISKDLLKDTILKSA